MGRELDFRILGPLELSRSGRPLPLAGGRQGALLAVLLVHANEVLDRDRLIEALWGAQPPKTARAALQGYVAQLRRLLPEDRLLTRAGGYVLTVEPGELDADRFERLLAEARTREPAEAATTLRAALSLWRGPPLLDVRYENFAQREVLRLEELRLAATEQRIEADLVLGRHHELVGELEGLTAEYPLRERLAAQLMLALYRCGRQADALDFYRRTRRAFVEELGIEPGSALKELERRILAQDRDLELEPTVAADDHAPAESAAPEPARQDERHVIGEGERRIVSVLVADIADSTGIGERLGPERSKFLFDEVLGLMRDEVKRYGGTVAQLTGDRLFALFGAPAAHEDDPERAVRAALSIQNAISAHGLDVEEAFGVVLRSRVAVNTGPVVFPDVEASPDVLYDALNDAVDVAASLQNAAGPGGVAVSAETARQVGGVFALEALGAIALKGKSEPVAAFHVAGAAEVTPARALPLVGRNAELAALCDALEKASQGRGVIVSITGEPGIGKTRLAAEARSDYAERIRFLEAHAVSYASAMPYVPVRELLRSWLGLGISHPEARLRLELKAALGTLLGDDSSIAYPFLGNLLGLALEREAEERLREYARDSVQLQTHEAVREVVRALARERPLCLFLEDLHWADEPTLALVEELFPLCDEEALSLALLHRDDPDHPSWDLVERARRRFRHRFSEIALAPLDVDDCASLAATAAGAELPAGFAALLAERSGGNPLFVEEVMRHLVERGALLRENGKLRLAGGADASIPMVVQEALQARLDHLARDTREVVSLAAVAGRRFSLPLLERLETKDRLLPALSELQRLDLVVEERAQPAPEYRFRHGLVQEAAYASLTSAGKRVLHRRVGEALEQLMEGEPERAYPALARHFTEADEPAKAADYLLRAGDAARALYADEESVSYYRRALSFLDRLGDTGRARNALFKIALTHHLAFDFEQANSAWQEAFARPEARPVRLDPTERLEAPIERPESFVPGYAYSELSWWLAQHVFRGLLALDRDLNVVPDAAERFDVSADGLSFRFRLRADLSWSDGAPVTALDFSSTWQAMRDDDVPTAHLLEDISTVEALDERTLEVRLRQAGNLLLYVLAQPPAFPWPHHLPERPRKQWSGTKRFVGNGPFVVVESDDGHVRLHASPTWRGARGNVGEIDIRFVTEREARERAWHSGRADVLRHASRHVGADAPETVEEIYGGLTTCYVGFRADVAPFSDVRLRTAFSHAVDRKRTAMATTWAVADPAWGGFIPPAMPGHSHRLGLELDLQRARDLIAAAGYPGGRGLPRLNLAAAAWETESIPALVAGWASLGIDVHPLFVSLADFMEGVPEQCQLWYWPFFADYPDPDGMLTRLLHVYPSLYRDAEIEASLRRARSLQDRDARMQLYRDAERIWIAERAAVLPVAYLRNRILRRPWVEGFWTSPILPATFDHVVLDRPA
jgi:ABC-type transport system substrate-binding protein/DNA-binding SARP family transcriptional activator